MRVVPDSFIAVKAAQRLGAIADDQLRGNQREIAVAGADRFDQPGGRILENKPVADDLDVARAISDKCRGIESHRLQSGQIHRVVEIDGRIAAQGQVLGVAERGQRGAVEHQTAAAANADAPGRQRKRRA